MSASTTVYNTDATALDAAIHTLKRGGLIIYPTETFYGLGVDPSNEHAVARLAHLKNRSGQQPIPLIAAGRQESELLGVIPTALLHLAHAFWPGPLTLTIEPHAAWPKALLGSGTTLGVRVSSHPVAHALAAAIGGLITSTSANLRGGPPAARVHDIAEALASEADLVLDGGELAGGAPSSVVGYDNQRVVLLREGAVSAAQLSNVLGVAIARV